MGHAEALEAEKQISDRLETKSAYIGAVRSLLGGLKGTGAKSQQQPRGRGRGRGREGGVQGH